MPYHIWSLTGLYQGCYSGETPQEALVSLCRHRGYGPDMVWLARGCLRYADETAELLCGDLSDYRIHLRWEDGPHEWPDPDWPEP